LETEITTEEVLTEKFRERFERKNTVNKILNYINKTYKAILWLLFTLLIVIVFNIHDLFEYCLQYISQSYKTFMAINVWERGRKYKTV